MAAKDSSLPPSAPPSVTSEGLPCPPVIDSSLSRTQNFLAQIAFISRFLAANNAKRKLNKEDLKIILDFVDLAQKLVLEQELIINSHQAQLEVYNGQADSLQKLLTLFEPSSASVSVPTSSHLPTTAEAQQEVQEDEGGPFTLIQRKKKRPQKKLSDNVLLLAPIDSTTSPIAIQKQLTSQLNPSRLGIPIEQIRTTRSKELLVRCNTREKLLKLKSSIEQIPSLKDSLTLREPKPRRESIILFGAPEEFTTKDIVTAFELHLPSNKVGTIHPRTPLHQSNSKNNWIIQLDRDYFNRLGSSGRIYLGFFSCPFRRYLRVPRCFNCQGLGHISRNCQEQPSCVQCAGPHSMPIGSCKEHPICKNCTLANQQQGTDHDCHHAASSRQCPVYRTAVQKLLRTAGQQ